MAGRSSRRALLALVVALSAFLLLLLLAGVTDRSASLDAAVKTAVEAVREPALTSVVAGFTHLGSWPVLTLAAAAVAVGLVLRDRRRAAVFLVAAMTAGIVGYVSVKAIVERPRPDAADAAVSVGGWAFPSGHATQAATFGLALAVIAWPTRWRWPVAVCAAVFAVLIGLSRAYLGVHWLTDVLAGWALAVAAVGGALLLVEALAGPVAAGQPGDPRDGPGRQTKASPRAGAAGPGRGAGAIDVVFLDWGNTLMVDHGEDGPMASWPVVTAVPGAQEALRRLRPHYRLIVATNADASGASLVRAALARVGLDELVDDVVSSLDVGACKPDKAFYRAALARAGALAPRACEERAPAAGAPPAAGAGLDPARAVMVGDSFENDVAGAMAAGLRAVWLDPARRPSPPGAPSPTARIATMRELPGVVAALAGDGPPHAVTATRGRGPDGASGGG